jgi:hypothetical protein
MPWEVVFEDEFDEEFKELSKAVQRELLAMGVQLERDGPKLGRPHVDTLNNSKFHNMKELRFNADGGVWRAAFAFDPTRKAIVLVAGDKSGGNEKQFYKALIAKADQRFQNHLNRLKAAAAAAKKEKK